MPRTSASNKQLVAKYLREFPAELFRSDGDILYCTACDKRVSCSQRSQVTQHIATGSHIENKNRKKERTSYQAFLTSPSSISDASVHVLAGSNWLKNRTSRKEGRPFFNHRNCNFAKTDSSTSEDMPLVLGAFFSMHCQPPEEYSFIYRQH
ncbi:uncharacterized protein [Rhodnius prolixus]|uniref:uncharacterized protein n=1 Tax=Rhodnius prolixus TaxID=13249 RepID=UPI003D18C108